MTGKGGGAHGHLPRLHSFQSFRHASRPVFPNLFFGVETPLKQNPSEAFFHLVKGLGGVLSEKAGFNSRKEIRSLGGHNGIF